MNRLPGTFLLLLALWVQILAPVATLWAVTGAAADPLAGLILCGHSLADANGDASDDDRQPAPPSLCGLCCAAIAVLDTPPPGRTGANLMTPDIAAVAARALAYREPGAAYDIRRLRTNLLSSQPLAFNLFAPLVTDPALAARFIAELVPTAQLSTVTDILFEHSPGRSDPRFTADRTAFDVVIRGTTATGARALICVEVKYSEAGHDAAPPPHPRYAEVARATPGLFVAPDDPTLIGPTCQQLYRQHCLASAMLTAGLADTATLAFIAPAHNHLAHASAATYKCQLTDPGAGPIPFVPLKLEHAFTALAAAGLPDHTRALHRRYTDW